MVVQKGHFLIHGDFSVLYLADTDPSHIFIVVDGADQYLGIRFWIALRSGDIFQDSLKKRSHIFRRVLKVKNRMTGFCGRIEERTVKLLVGSVQIHQKFQYLVDHFVGTGFGTVNLIDADNDMKIQLQGFFQYELGLGHCALKSVHKKDHAVYHFQHTLYLSAEIRMSGGVDNVDLNALIMDGRVLGQNGDAALALDIIGIHDTLLNLLILAENAALFQKLVHQSCLSVVNVSDNGHVTHIFAFDFHKDRNPFFLLLY